MKKFVLAAALTALAGFPACAAKLSPRMRDDGDQRLCLRPRRMPIPSSDNGKLSAPIPMRRCALQLRRDGDHTSAMAAN